MSMKVREGVGRQWFVRRRVARRLLGVATLTCGRATQTAAVGLAVRRHVTAKVINAVG